MMEEPASSSSSIYQPTTKLRRRHSSYSLFYCYADLRKYTRIRIQLLYIVSVSLFLTAGVLDARLLDTSVSCDQNNFILSLNFDSPFQGIVYSEEGFPNCVYVNGTMLSHTSYQLKIPLVGCETHTNLDGNFENAIIIQESDRLLQATDKKYLLTCIPSATPPLTSNSLGGSGMSPHSKDSVSPNGTGFNKPYENKPKTGTGKLTDR
uniref:ZP domain-containing protein n=1 Tax=Ditylenchus dipsaci TaxID=166011 RepID=A0A915EGW1_9BILA